MDLVERAAVLLGATSASKGKAGAHVELQDARRLNRLERVAVDAELSGKPGDAPEQEMPGQDNRAADVDLPRSRRVTVDLSMLQAHRIMTPAEGPTMMIESFRRVKRHIVANLNNRAGARPPNLVMMTSALPGEGKTFCSINLAISLAMEVNRTVLLVDADVGNPCVFRTMGIAADMTRGFVDVVADPGLDFSEVLYKTNLGELTLMAAGTPQSHTTELFAGEATAALLQQMATRYEDRIIIFDSAPLLVASESSALAAHMGQIVLVVEAGRTTEKAFKEALSRVASFNVAGVLLNKGSPSAGFRPYGYGYGYGTAV